MTNKNSIGPIASDDRFFTLDLMRGIAVLGILIMNIQSFSMIEAAYLNPTAFGDLTGVNKWVWILSHIFADQKFMTIFSVLFGAGIILFSEKAEKKGLNPASLHYKRIWWLFVFGMIHAYLLWHGDILVPYALCGLFVYLFRKNSPRVLVIVGLISITIPSLLYFLFDWSMQFWPDESISETMKTWRPAFEQYSKEIIAFQGTWSEQMSYRVPSSIKFQTFIFLIWTSWRAGGLMLIGMALYKIGFLTSKKNKKFYLNSILIGFIIGIPIVVLGIVNNFKAGFNLNYSMFIGWQYNYWGSLFIAFGLMAFINYLYLTFKNSALNFSFSVVGRMAFTNYLLQTIFCTILFYGHGFGLFAQVERQYQILIVLIIWIILILFSRVWLNYYQFGPAEWLWRSLTYMKIQPFKKQ